MMMITIRDRIGCTTEEATYQLPLQVKPDHQTNKDKDKAKDKDKYKHICP